MELRKYELIKRVVLVRMLLEKGLLVEVDNPLGDPSEWYFTPRYSKSDIPDLQRLLVSKYEEYRKLANGALEYINKKELQKKKEQEKNN